MADRPVEPMDERNPPDTDEGKRVAPDPAAGRDRGPTDPDDDPEPEPEPEPEAPQLLKDTTMKW